MNFLRLASLAGLATAMAAPFRTLKQHDPDQDGEDEAFQRPRADQQNFHMLQCKAGCGNGKTEGETRKDSGWSLKRFHCGGHLWLTGELSVA